MLSALIGISGPHITFAAAIYSHVLVSQRLTDYIFLGPHADEREHDAARRVALMIRALNTLRDELDEYYNKLKPVKKDDEGAKHAKRRKLLEGTESSPGEFRGKEPTFSTFLRDGAEYQLKYIQRLVPSQNHKGVLLAAATRTGTEGVEGDTVVVKFAKTYRKEAHALLEQHDPPLAPLMPNREHTTNDSIIPLLVLEV